MAEPYDVLASLNRMLESEERREQYKLQASLSLMQFAQQKRMQDIQLAGQRLELLQAANTQMMGTQAQTFLEETGLEAMYLRTLEDVDDQAASVASMSDLLQEKAKDGGWGVPQDVADKIVGAVYASKSGQHSGIMKIGTEMYEYAQTEHDYSTFGKNLVLLFDKVGVDMPIGRLGQMYQTSSNQSKILKEMFDFGQGDYDIDPDIGMDIVTAPDDELDEALSKVADEGDQIGQQEIKSIITDSSLREDVGKYENQIEQLNTEIQGQYEDISNLQNQKRMIDAKRFSGIELSETEQDFLNRTGELKALGEAEIQNLNSQIRDLREEQSKYKMAEFTSRPIPGTQIRKGTLVDEEELFIGGTGGMSGRLY